MLLYQLGAGRRAVNRVVFLLPVPQAFQPVQDIFVLPWDRVASLTRLLVLICRFVCADIEASHDFTDILRVDTAEHPAFPRITLTT
ncbi:hypothetical protein D3C81_1683200 [compost metagenome]